jgi:hypothetical protein
MKVLVEVGEKVIDSCVVDTLAFLGVQRGKDAQ